MSKSNGHGVEGGKVVLYKAPQCFQRSLFNWDLYSGFASTVVNV